LAWRVPSLELPTESAASTEQLSLNPAVQLFVQRATAAQPRFALIDRNASAVVQICRRLDGIPLAMELAAARVEALTADQIALRLDQRFRLLTGGSRAALPRQQTPAATLDWSHDLLSGPERRLVERLAVFSGSWTLEAAEAVCADGRALTSEAVLDLLAHLTRKFAGRRRGIGRWRPALLAARDGARLRTPEAGRARHRGNQGASRPPC